MIKMKGRWLVFIFVSILVIPSSVLAEEQTTEVNEEFRIYLTSPNTSTAGNQWGLLIEQLLPQIGIGVEIAERNTWYNWNPWFPPPEDLYATYENGGYDAVLVGLSWGLDWNPTGLYDSASLLPQGANFYGYENPEYDALLEAYLTELDEEERTLISHQMQAILYEDLPSICLVYPKSLFGMRTGIIGIDPILFASGNYRVENWIDNNDQRISIAIPANLKEYNLYVVESYYDAFWMQAIYGSLFARDQDTHFWEPMIASNMSYAIGENSLNMTVDIDPNAKFTDGSQVLAEDVKYSYELHMTPAVRSSSYGYLTKWFASNDSIEIIDTNTLKFCLTDIFAFAPKLLSFGIIDKSSVQTAISTYGHGIFNDPPLTADVGDVLVKSCGPMMLSTYDTVNSVVNMSKNPYWNQLDSSGGTLPYLQELKIQLISGKDTALSELLAGNVDIIDSQYFLELSELEGQVGVEAFLVDDPYHQEMAINLHHPIIGTGELTPNGTAEAAKWIRKAISHAIPREVIVEDILKGLGTPGVTSMPRTCVGFDESLQPYEYNLTLAIEWMQKAGYEVYASLTSVTNFAWVSLSFLAIVSLLKYKKRRKFG